MSNPHDLAAEAWEQFLRTAVSDGAQPHEVFAWAYMAGWAHDKWPAVRDIGPPPDVTGGRTEAEIAESNAERRFSGVRHRAGGRQ